MKIAPTCIKCLSPNAIVSLTARMCGGNIPEFKCEACGAEFDCEDVRNFLAAQKGWEKIIAWVDAMPDDSE